jgi:hypothetical protein
MERLIELEVGTVFDINGRSYIKLSNGEISNSNITAIDKDPLLSIPVCDVKGANDIGPKIFSRATIFNLKTCSEEDRIPTVEDYAKYRSLIASNVHDCWFVRWSNEAQGMDGDCCYIDESGDYCIVNKTSDHKQINGNGTLNIRQIHWFNPNTIVNA